MDLFFTYILVSIAFAVSLFLCLGYSRTYNRILYITSVVSFYLGISTIGISSLNGLVSTVILSIIAIPIITIIFALYEFIFIPNHHGYSRRDVSKLREQMNEIARINRLSLEESKECDE